MLSTFCSKKLRQDAQVGAIEYFCSAYVDPSLRSHNYSTRYNIDTEDNCDVVGLTDTFFQKSGDENNFIDSKSYDSGESLENDALVLMLKSALSPKIDLLLSRAEDTNADNSLVESTMRTSMDCKTSNEQKSGFNKNIDANNKAITPMMEESCSITRREKSGYDPFDKFVETTPKEELVLAPLSMVIFKNLDPVEGNNNTTLKQSLFEATARVEHLKPIVESQNEATKEGHETKGSSTFKLKDEENIQASGSIIVDNSLSNKMSSAHLRLYEDCKRRRAQITKIKNDAVPERDTKKSFIEEARPLNHNSVHLRLYSQSQKLQVEGKKRRQLRESTQLENESCLHDGNRFRSFDTQYSVQRKDTRKQLKIRPNTAQLRLYKHMTKSQMYSLKHLEEGAVDDDNVISAGIGPNPAQLRLYDQSKKLREEGRERRTFVESKAITKPPLANSPSALVEATPTQIRLYNKSKPLQEEGKTRRKTLEAKKKVLIAHNKAFMINGTKEGSQYHSYGDRVDKRRHKREPICVNRNLPKGPIHRTYTKRFFELKLKREMLKQESYMKNE